MDCFPEGYLALPILVADDNPGMRAALRLVLEEAGQWRVREAANGEEVLDLAREHSFQLIILDLAMPGMDGISVARILTARYPGLPILMHTLYWSQRVAVEALKVGVRKVIPKSDKATILNAVREILDAESAKVSQSPELALRVEMSQEERLTSSSPTVLPENPAGPGNCPSNSEASDASAPKV